MTNSPDSNRKTIELLDMLLILADDQKAQSLLASLISNDAFSACKSLNILNPSVGDISLIGDMPRLGISVTVALAKEFQWDCGVACAALVRHMDGEIERGAPRPFRTAQFQAERVV